MTAPAAASSSEISPLRWRRSQGTPCAFVAGKVGSSLRSSSNRTSSSAPAFNIVSNRVSIRRTNSLRSHVINILVACSELISGGRPSRCQSDSGRPVATTTSSAREIRDRSLIITRWAVSGSSRTSSSCNAGAPSRCNRLLTSVRMLAGIGGTAANPAVRALKYRPVPPTKMGRRCCAIASPSAALTSPNQRPTE